MIEMRRLSLAPSHGLVSTLDPNLISPLDTKTLKCIDYVILELPLSA